MNEIECELKKENRQKKDIANNAFKKAGGRGGRCRMPSDYLNNKQKRGLNGKVETVKLNQPMDYRAFKRLSETLQKEYLTNLVEKYGARQSDVAEMFNISRPVINRIFKTVTPEIKFSGSRVKKVDKRWIDFIKGEEREPTVVDMLTKTYEWSKFDNEPKPEVNPAEEIRKEAKELGINTQVESKANICEGSITMNGSPALVFNRMEYLLDKNSKYEITINFKEI